MGLWGEGQEMRLQRWAGTRSWKALRTILGNFVLSWGWWILWTNHWRICWSQGLGETSSNLYFRRVVLRKAYCGRLIRRQDYVNKPTCFSAVCMLGSIPLINILVPSLLCCRCTFCVFTYLFLVVHMVRTMVFTFSCGHGFWGLLIGITRRKCISCV